MTYTYKVTAIGIAVNSWQEVKEVLFASAQPIEETYGGQQALYTFATPQTPADLGPLVKVELLP
jgi:hypothetical protein